LIEEILQILLFKDVFYLYKDANINIILLHDNNGKEPYSIDKTLNLLSFIFKFFKLQLSRFEIVNLLVKSFDFP